MKKIIILGIILLPLFASCKKEPEPVPPVVNELTPAMARDSLYYLMKQWYYWYDKMPAVVKENYPDPYRLLEALRYRELDYWSFVADYNEFLAEMQGEFVGHGIRIGIDETHQARVAQIYSESPLYKDGVRRGWIIKSINGADIAEIIISGDAARYNTVMGPSSATVTNNFVFINPKDEEISVSSTKASFKINSVILYDTLHLVNDRIAGHLVFESFIQPSSAELETAFAFFKSCDVDELILDLRYNTGGYLYVAQELASYIAGDVLAEGKATFATMMYNNKNQKWNESYPFKKTKSPLGLDRLMVITAPLTASASEAVINGLKPFIDVICIGDTTYGKPMGMNGWEVGEKYFFWPVTFKLVNSNNEGDYFDGFPPDRLAPDDITHDFDSRKEACLKEAIHYLETGSFASKGLPSFHRYPRYSEKPAWVERGLTLIK